MGAYSRWALNNFSYLQGRRLFEAGRLITFPTYRVGAYSRWALIRGGRLLTFPTYRVGAYSRWALINFSYLQGGRLPCSMKILREFYFADWRFFVVCGNKFLRFEITEISVGN